jgi:hypothetical protein
MVLALLGAAIVGWLLVVGGWAAITAIEALGSALAGNRPALPSADIVLPMAMVLAAYGLPVAGVVCLLIGLPIWWLAMRRGWTTSAHALRLGAIVGLAIGLLLLANQLRDGIAIARNPDAQYDRYALGIQMIDDGLPTVAGWVREVFDLGLLAAVGAAVALTAHRLGRKRRPA